MNAKKRTIEHIPMDQFDVEGGELLINGRKLTQLKLQANNRPFYAYDKSVIAKKIALFRQLMPDNLRLNYAVKANPMIALVDFMANRVDGLDVASGNELRTALNSGKNSKDISFAGPAKNSDELTQAIAAGVTLNVESFRELDSIEEISRKIGINANVAIRVNPNFELKSSGMKMGGGPQQFGVDAEEVPRMLATIEQMKINYRGLHIFTGSQNLNVDSIMLAHRNLFKLASELHRQTPLPIKTLNIGGGLGIPYFPGEKKLCIESIGRQLDKEISLFTDEFGDVEISMELGRYLVGEAGIYVTEVVDIKHSRDSLYLIVNGGLNHHLSVTGNFGQVVRKNYPVAIGNKMDQKPVEKSNVVGPLCTPLDILAKNFPLPKAEIGDLFVVYQSGAYGFSASPKDFLNHQHPIEMLV